MNGHEGSGGRDTLELAHEVEARDGVEGRGDFDELINSLMQQAVDAEPVDKRRAESWANKLARVGGLDEKRAEKKVADGTPSPEGLEKKTTAEYEAEILALNKFAESADFLDEPMEEPTETDLIRNWQRSMMLHNHVEEVQDWLHSNGLSEVDKKYRGELLGDGDVKSKLFYRPDAEVAETWENEKTIYINRERKNKIEDFSREQDYVERRLETAISNYEPSSEGQMSGRGDLVRKWINGGEEADPNNADLIIDWLRSDDGNDMEKRYRALTRVRLSDQFSRFRAERGNESLRQEPVNCMRIPIYAHAQGRQEFVDKLRSGELSSGFAELSNEEKESRWKEAEEAERQRALDKKAERERRETSKRIKQETTIFDHLEESGSSKSTNERTTEEYQGQQESTSVPNQDPDLTDPL